jgi:uncharacterized protein (TIGR02996 family)
MPRFERKKPAGTLYWEIEPAGASFTIRAGKVGSDDDPTEIVREFPSPIAADKELKRLISGKKTEGYLEVEEVPEVEGNPELEKAIAADPDSTQPYLVYADWLQAHGDPRGELIVVQHDLHGAPAAKREELEARARALIQRHSVHLLGELAPLADGDAGDLEWRLGFLRAARIRNAEEDLVRGFLGHRSALALRRLALGGRDEARDLEPAISVLCERDGARPPLLELAIGPEAEPADELDEYERMVEGAVPSIGSLSPLWRVYPGLSCLRVRGADATFGAISAPELTTLELDLAISPTNVLELGRAKLPKIERLEIAFRNGSVQGEESAFDWILRLGRLRDLAFRSAFHTNPFVAKLAASPVAERLVSLDLSDGSLDDAGAAPLLAAGSFPKLERLDLSRNVLGGAVARELKEKRGAIVADQETHEERYAADEYDDIVE